MVKNRLAQLFELKEKRPDDPFILYAIGLEYIKESNDAEAITFFQLVQDTHPDYLAVYYHYGKLRERLNQPSAALLLFERGREIATQQGDQHSLAELQGAITQLNDPFDETFED